MSKLKRLATKEDVLTKVITLENSAAKSLENDDPTVPVSFSWNGTIHQIQFNLCSNPSSQQSSLPPGARSLKKADLVSNKVAVEEISRLIRINTILEMEPDYHFHYEHCDYLKATPFEKPHLFYKRGKSTAKSQRYQCKLCNKITNVLPARKQSTTYHQKRNDILPTFFKFFLNNISTAQTIKTLGIGASTYYHKLEWIYRRCLEFLERHEIKTLANTKFDTISLKCDEIWNLQNKSAEGLSPISLFITSDVRSRYIVRTDLSFDWDTATNNEGLCVQPVYTAMAHLWLIKTMIQTDNWRFTTDEPNVLTNSIDRVFSSEIGKDHNKISDIDIIVGRCDDTAADFIQLIGRRLAKSKRSPILKNEEGKSYFYSNFNLKYSHYALTILRTYYNFCIPCQFEENQAITPAQKFGLSKKRYSINDILYMQ